MPALTTTYAPGDPAIFLDSHTTLEELKKAGWFIFQSSGGSWWWKHHATGANMTASWYREMCREDYERGAKDNLDTIQNTASSLLNQLGIATKKPKPRKE